jgi:ribonucleoside-diphosphate reductase alpha chain
MGIADMLISMGIRYGSETAIAISEEIGRIMATAAIRKSCSMARENGAYPLCNPEEVVRTTFFKENISNTDLLDDVLKYGLLNSQLLTIAPTGTLSTMLGISGGIEPIFANYYERKTESLHGKDVTYKVYTPIVERYMKEHGIEDDKNLPDFFVTAQTLPYKERIAMQSAWQKHIDASISSTVNVPHEFTVEDTESLYIEAWKAGLKGITIFRDRCKRAGIFTITTTEDDTSEPVELKRGVILPVSDSVIGKKRKLSTGCGSLHCTAFFDPMSGDLMETYLSKGSTGGCANFTTGLSRMISLASRAGCDIHSIVDQLNSTGVCPSYAVRSATKHDTSRGACCPMAVGNVLLDMWQEMQNEIHAGEKTKNATPVNKTPTASSNHKNETTSGAICPSCGGHLVFEGGCNSCKDCGWSKCS